MFSIVVFSKDRPLQLHAYLESLLYFSDTKENNITVLYNDYSKISYEKVINFFSSVNWVRENDFYKDLQKILKNSQDYIMFGCDDVVFNHSFNLGESVDILESNDNIFGASIRLGKNITPFPKNAENKSNYYSWVWKNETSHYGYPWELDCTLYRKSDICDMLNKCDESGENIKSPNFLESIIAGNTKKYITRSKIACYEISSAIVITVNRVQDTHCNPVDQSMKTDVYTLDSLYNQDNNSLDIQEISKLKNKSVHVGAEYFILKNKDKAFIQKKKKKKSSIITFVNNIRYLCRYNLKEMDKKIVTDEYLFQAIKAAKYQPRILTAKETVEALIEKEQSIARFGDGEFEIIKGNSIPFQKYDAKMSFRLKEVLKSNDKNIIIGIPHIYFNYNINCNDTIKSFCRTWVVHNMDNIISHVDMDKQYCDTSCTQMYAQFESMDFRNYFNSIKQIWNNKNITIICGKNVFNNIKNNIFDCAKSIEYLHAPSKDAFFEYDKILNDAFKIDKNRLILVILGPTATILAYDLAKAGYRALDFGHIAKDYDYFIQKIKRNNDTIQAFYDPDQEV